MPCTSQLEHPSVLSIALTLSLQNTTPPHASPDSEHHSSPEHHPLKHHTILCVSQLEHPLVLSITLTPTIALIPNTTLFLAFPNLSASLS